MDSAVIYIFLNKGLKMSVGKAAAQAAHAAAMSITHDSSDSWVGAAKRTILVFEAKDEHHLTRIAKYLKERHIDVNPIIDEGVNEVDPMSTTAMSTLVLDREDVVLKEIFSQFKLYKEFIRFHVEIDR